MASTAPIHMGEMLAIKVFGLAISTQFIKEVITFISNEDSLGILYLRSKFAKDKSDCIIRYLP